MDKNNDQANVYTLDVILKKTKRVSLNRLYKTHDVLRKLISDPTSYQHIIGLFFEFHYDFIQDMRQAYLLENVTEFGIS